MMGPDRASLPKKYTAIVHPAKAPLSGTINAQPSKNYTTRYLLVAGLANGRSLVRNCAASADSKALQRCLKQLGAQIDILDGSDSAGRFDFSIVGVAGTPHLVNAHEQVNVGNAGAVLRMLLAIGALLPEVTFATDHPDSLGKRPNQDLLNSLEQLGCRTESRDGRLPIKLYGGSPHGGSVTISGARSSQFLSGLLFLAPLIGESLEITVVDGLVSKAPVRQTLEVLRGAGAQILSTPDLLSFTVHPRLYEPGQYSVNGDWPGSAALLAAAAVTGGEITISGLVDDEQGEKAAGNVLAQMGAKFDFMPGGGIKLSATEQLRSVEFDGDLATDAVLALMGAACLASGKTRFYNVSNL